MQPTDTVADTICRTIELGVTITNAAISETATVIDCQPVQTDPACPGCGQVGRLRDHVDRVLTDLPISGHPTRLRVRVPRLICENTYCPGTIFRGGIDRVAGPRSVTTRRCSRWILQRLVIDKMSVSAVARQMGLGWDTVNTLALSTVRKLVYDTPGHLDQVRYLGVDEHKWKHCRGQGGASFVSIIVDLTPVITGTGPARLLDMVPGRSAAAMSDWLDGRDQSFRDAVEVVSLDGFAGYHRAAAQSLPAATTVMDPFHVIHLAAQKLTVCRQRIQQDTRGHRGRAGEPLYGIRRTLLTRTGLLTARQTSRLEQVFADDGHIAVEVTHGVYQALIAAYDEPDPKAAKKAMDRVLRTIRTGLPAGLEELAQLGRSLWRRRREILAYFDTGASNGPVEAINGRLEHLRGTALGFRNLGHYILRSLIHSGQLHNRINAL